MRKSRNLVIVALMMSSIGLLLVLQFLWLRSSYNRAFDDLHKETNQLFKSTVLALQDSLLERSIEPMPGDTVKGRSLYFNTTDSLRIIEADSVIEHFGRHDKISRVQIVVTPGEGDSLKHMIKPLASRFYNYHGQGKFIMRLGPDSIAVYNLNRDFKAALSSAGIDLTFEVIHLKHNERLPFKKGFFVSEQVRINPVNRYAAFFSEGSSILLKRIIPQILFSIFLTALTIGSFYMMYRNVVTQQRLAELKNDFISNVTHELKTPITTVKVALEALRDFKGLENPQLTREYLDIAQSELNRLTILTDKVLKTSIFESKGVALNKEKIDLTELIEQILGSMKLVFEKSAAVVTFRQEGEQFVLEGSRDHLTNVVYNLLDNALKYSAAPAQVELAIRYSDEAIKLTISDRGPGIPAEYQEKIFEKFFRIPTGDVHNVKGYGLGLNYVHSVVRGHKGTIDVESIPGKGSTFIIKIPKG